MEIKVLHVYTGDDGESHFEDIYIPLDTKRGKFRESKSIQVTGMHFVELDNNDNGLVVDWHNASRRQILISLEGENEQEISDGTKRTLKPGDIFWAEDTTGKGHITRWSKGHHTVLAVTID